MRTALILCLSLLAISASAAERTGRPSAAGAGEGSTVTAPATGAGVDTCTGNGCAIGSGGISTDAGVTAIDGSITATMSVVGLAKITTTGVGNQGLFISTTGADGLVPLATASHSLGRAANRWTTIWLSGALDSSVASGSVAIQTLTGARTALGTGGIGYLWYDVGTTSIQHSVSVGVPAGSALCLDGSTCASSYISYDSGTANTYFRGMHYAYGTSGVSRVDSNQAPTITSACTSPTVTNNTGTFSFRIDVGTTCAGVSTVVLALPATTNGWNCFGRNKTNALAALEQTGADSTTAVTMTNYTRTTGVVLAFTDGDDLSISCRGG